MATFAVVHGAGDVGSSWRLVGEELRARGHELVAPDLPCEDDGAGWQDYADTVAEAIGDRDDLVVVSHSLGGFAAPLLCTRRPVRLLVGVSAMVPVPGETASAWWGNTGIVPAQEAARKRGGWGTDEIATYLHDVSPELAREALAVSRDQSGTPMEEPWPLDAWPEVPTRYVLCTQDRFFPAEWMRGVVRERLGIEPDELDASHAPYLSRPRELAELLIRLHAELEIPARN